MNIETNFKCHPIGTKYPSLSGGYWVKFDENRFKFINGGITTDVGKDWNGDIIFPEKMYTPEYINELNENEIFVFGSNKNGFHYGGAAAIAFKSFGAVWGVSEGLSGNSYAIPTLDEKMEKVSREELENSIINFIKFANNNRKLKFYLTKIGCGIAGWSIDDIKSIINSAIYKSSPDEFKGGIPTNIIMPIEFVY